MLPFRSYPISRKLILISMISTASALMFTITVLIIYDIIATKQSIREELSILTTVIGDSSSAALIFHDKDRASDNLAALKAQHSIVSACLYTNDGSVFATYSRGHTNESACQPLKLDSINRNEDDIQFRDSKFYQPEIFLSKPILLDGQLIGVIKILFDTSNIQIRIYNYIAIVTIIFFITVGAAFLLSSRLQRVISVPINQLGKTAKHITEHNDYSIRAVKHNEDELGLLVDAFNNMLKTIEEQNVVMVATKERYRIMYDDNPAMLFTIDFDGKVLSINQFGAEQSGYTIDELIGQPLLNLIYEEDKEIVLANIKICLSQPEDVHTWKTRMKQKNGNILWVKNKARIITGNDGKPTMLIMCENITEEKILSEQLSFHASHDELTGLTNRREFNNRIGRILDTARKNHTENALCYLDLDQFKVINDTCGHVAGDELLRQLSSILNNHIRKRDTLARLGGDEFGVLMEHCTLEQAQRVANELHQSVSNFRFMWEKKSFTLGVSIGIVTITDRSGGITEILQHADAACYAAKEAGRNRINVYNLEDENLLSRHGEMQWVSKINSALQKNLFRLVYQPIIPIQNTYRENAHFELLIRMIDDKGNSIPPNVFLPAAERYNLSTKIDRWVVNSAIDWLTSNPDILQNLSLCSINLSGHTFCDDEFLSFLIQKFDTSKIPANKLCFEITETAAISNLIEAGIFIETLKGLGCKFALDDFGSGLSSFGYLKNLPVDFLKIDGVFVKGIQDDPIDFEMVRSINGIGHVMGKKTIAEFVENREILEKLKDIGVDFAQGYGIGEPLPIENYEIIAVAS